jgi:hypothetical protein
MEVLIIRGPMPEADANHVRNFLDVMSGRQGLWRVAEEFVLDPISEERAQAMEEGFAGKLVLLLRRGTVATAFGFRDLGWFEMRPRAGAVFTALPTIGPTSKWWAREGNLERARSFLLSVVDHFSPRFGKPAGTFEDLLPTARSEVTGPISITNYSDKRAFTLYDGSAHGCRVLPGGRHEFQAERPWSLTWDPALCAERATAHVQVGIENGVRVWYEGTRGLTAKELDVDEIDGIEAARAPRADNTI